MFRSAAKGKGFCLEAKNMKPISYQIWWNHPRKESTFNKYKHYENIFFFIFMIN